MKRLILLSVLLVGVVGLSSFGYSEDSEVSGEHGKFGPSGYVPWGGDFGRFSAGGGSCGFTGAPSGDGKRILGCGPPARQ
jgi:hypothetical protein